MTEFKRGIQAEKRVSGKVSDGLMRLARLANAPAGGIDTGGNLVNTTAERYLTNNGLVAISAVASVQADQLLSDLKKIGISGSSTFGKTISGWLPINAIEQLESVSSLKLAKVEYRPLTSNQPKGTSTQVDRPVSNVGLVTSQGDAAQRSDVARLEFNVSGSGVTVGVLSDSFNARNEAQRDIASGDLPSTGVQVLEDLAGQSDEGRAMLQIVHDIAPGAQLAFNTAFTGQAAFANGIINLAKPTSQGGAGAKVIVDDVFYFAEPFFQDGIVAQAVNTVASNGSVAYFSSAGNQGTQAYEIAWNGNFSLGEYNWHDFDRVATTSDYFQDIKIAPNSSFAPILQWDQPFASASTTGRGSANDLDFYLLRTPTFDFSAGNVIASSQEFNIGGDPFEFLEGTNNSASGLTAYLAIGQFNGSGGGGPVAGRIKYLDVGSGGDSNRFEYATNSPASFGHNQSAFGLGVAAADYRDTPAFGQNPPLPEPFTSLGGTAILFDTAGNRLPSPQNRNQPGITAPDGVSTTVPVEGLTNFFGTSAAAPSAAAVAALILEKVPNASNQQIYNALKGSAIDMAAPGFDSLTGAGLIQADAAIRSLAGSSLPTITSATYNASTGVLSVTAKTLITTAGSANDITVRNLTIAGEGGATYTLTSPNVEISSPTSFSIPLNTVDKDNINQILNRNGIVSTSGSTYNIAGANGWNTANPTASDLTGNALNVSNVAIPTITGAMYNSSTGQLVVTGKGFLKLNGSNNDVNVSKFTIKGQANATRTLTSSNVEITSGTTFTVNLNSEDKTALLGVLNKNGTTSVGGTVYNLAAADDWAAGAAATLNIADLTGNGITASEVPPPLPTITNARYNAFSGLLSVTATGLTATAGSMNDVLVNNLTIAGEGNATYTLTSPNVEIASATSFSVPLNAIDRDNVNQILNKNGLASTSGSPYNLAGASGWIASNASASDLNGNPVTASNVPIPTITSATYNAASGQLVVTGRGFVKLSGAENDINVFKLTIKGQGNATRTLASGNVEIVNGNTFTVNLNSQDRAALAGILNKNGQSSTGGTVYNLAAADDWSGGTSASLFIADLLGNRITVSDVAVSAASKSQIGIMNSETDLLVTQKGYRVSSAMLGSTLAPFLIESELFTLGTSLEPALF